MAQLLYQPPADLERLVTRNLESASQLSSGTYFAGLGLNLLKLLKTIESVHLFLQRVWELSGLNHQRKDVRINELLDALISWNYKFSNMVARSSSDKIAKVAVVLANNTSSWVTRHRTVIVRWP